MTDVHHNVRSMAAKQQGGKSPTGATKKGGRGTRSMRATDSSAYDVTNFYTSASDGRGHGYEVRFRLPPEIVGMAERLVASGRIPDYRTTPDVFRDGTVHRLHWAMEYVGSEEGMRQLRRIEARQTQERIKAEIEFLEGYVSGTEETAEHCLRTGDYRRLMQSLLDAEDKLDDLEEPWTGRMRTLIDRYVSKLPDVEAVEYIAARERAAQKRAMAEGTAALAVADTGDDSGSS